MERGEAVLTSFLFSTSLALRADMATRSCVFGAPGNRSLSSSHPLSAGPTAGVLHLFGCLLACCCLLRSLDSEHDVDGQRAGRMCGRIQTFIECLTGLGPFRKNNSNPCFSSIRSQHYFSYAITVSD